VLLSEGEDPLAVNVVLHCNGDSFARLYDPGPPGLLGSTALVLRGADLGGLLLGAGLGPLSGLTVPLLPSSLLGLGTIGSLGILTSPPRVALSLPGGVGLGVPTRDGPDVLQIGGVVGPRGGLDLAGEPAPQIIGEGRERVAKPLQGVTGLHGRLATLVTGDPCADDLDGAVAMLDGLPDARAPGDLQAAVNRLGAGAVGFVVADARRKLREAVAV